MKIEHSERKRTTLTFGEEVEINVLYEDQIVSKGESIQYTYTNTGPAMIYNLGFPGSGKYIAGKVQLKEPNLDLLCIYKEKIFTIHIKLQLLGNTTDGKRGNVDSIIILNGCEFISDNDGYIFIAKTMKVERE